MGYIENQMIERTVQPYEDCERPMNKWNKSNLIDAIRDWAHREEIDLDSRIYDVPFSKLKKYALIRSSWNHTGALYAKTDLYDLNTTWLKLVAEHRISNSFFIV